MEWIPDSGQAFFSLRVLTPLPSEEQNDLTLTSEVADNIDYYFIYGDNMDDLIQGYRQVTGKATLLPNWAFGLWQCRERYKNEKEILDVVKEYRKRQIPLDNIVLDWFYWKEDQWGSHEMDPTRFPDPGAMINKLHNDLHAHFMISVWPKFYVGTEHYNEMNEKGYLYPKNVELGTRDWVGKGYVSTFYDAFNPGARDLFWQQINEHLNSKGIDAWWLDATEPDIHSNLSIEERKERMSPTWLGPGAKYFNAYSLENSRGVYEGERKDDPDKRAFILTRSAFAGQQRYASVTWSGDIVARWKNFKEQISAGVNFSMSGIPYWTTDIGGFAVERRYENAKGEDLKEFRELFTRWFQFGAFCPIFRIHGQYPYREIYNVAENGSVEYNSMVYYDKLRYRLMPYIYSLAGSAYHDDQTIMRGLVMDFENDKDVLNVNDQYMFGPSLLINPVYDYKARERSVYLPKPSGWFDLYTGKYYAGGQKIQALAPLEKMPVFVKAGAIVPTGPEIQFITTEIPDILTLYVYGGSDGNFDLYEDEGTNYNYENGMFSKIPFSYNSSTKELTIGKRIGSFSGMKENRKFQIIFCNEKNPVGIDDRTAQKTVEYTGDEITIPVN